MLDPAGKNSVAATSFGHKKHRLGRAVLSLGLATATAYILPVTARAVPAGAPLDKHDYSIRITETQGVAKPGGVEGIRAIDISIDGGAFFPGLNMGNNTWDLTALTNINPGVVVDFVNVSDPKDKGGDTAVLTKVDDSIQLKFQSDAFDPPDEANTEEYIAIRCFPPSTSRSELQSK
jgi:hypothetical protein